MFKPMYISGLLHKQFTRAAENLKNFALLMCLKDTEDKGIEKEKPEEMEKSNECPLCMDPLEMDDKNFFPCSCGYQVCRFCWHRIKTTENGLCPACRRIYPENPANFVPLSQEELQKLRLQKKMKEVQKKQKVAENRKQLANIRVIQKNLVFSVGLPLELSQDIEKKDKILQMFRKYGPTLKETITDRTNYAGAQGPSACVYITYQKQEDAVKAVKSLTNTKVEGRTIKVSLGTTKYCSNFLKGVHCPKTECLYLHELADEEASFTKEDIHAGKHLEYETKILDQTYNNSSHNKFPISSNETNCVNHNHNDEGSESSDEVHQNNSYANSDISDLSPSSNQTLQNNRNIFPDVNNQVNIESKHQSIHSNSTELRTLMPHNHACDTVNSPKSIFSSEENIVINNSNFQDTINPHYSNHIQNEDVQNLHQPNFLSNQIFENASMGRSSPKESAILKLISSTSNAPSKPSNVVQNVSPPSKPNNHVQNVLQAKHYEDPELATRKPSNVIQSVVQTVQAKHYEDPELGFDPCQESLKGLQDLIISEANDLARRQLNAMNQSPVNKSPTLTAIQSMDSLGFRNTSFQALKVRDPPPGFSNNCSQNLHFKTPYENASSLLNKSPLSLHNQLGNLRTNFSLQRYPQPGVSVNNSYFQDFTTPTLPSREIPEYISPVLHQQQQQQQQQQQSQRLMNLSQLQYNVTEQRSSPLWNNTSQSQWRPMESMLFNQSIAENRTTNDYSLRMPIRSNEPTLRQQWQQFPTNVNNISPFQGTWMENYE